MHARVLVTLKKGVLDPAGQAVRSGLHELGFREVEEVRLGKLIEIQLGELSRSEAEQRVAEMAKKLLANPVIEDFTVELVP